jgi:hypothetical protein
MFSVSGGFLTQRKLEYGRHAPLDGGEGRDSTERRPLGASCDDDSSGLLPGSRLYDDEIALAQAKVGEGKSLESQRVQPLSLPGPRRKIEPTLDASGRQTFGGRCEGRGMVGVGTFVPYSCLCRSAEHGKSIGEKNTKLKTKSTS